MIIKGHVPTEKVLYKFVPLKSFNYDGNAYLAGLRYSVREGNEKLDVAVKLFSSGGLVEILEWQ